MAAPVLRTAARLALQYGPTFVAGARAINRRRQLKRELKRGDFRAAGMTIQSQLPDRADSVGDLPL